MAEFQATREAVLRAKKYPTRREQQAKIRARAVKAMEIARRERAVCHVAPLAVGQRALRQVSSR